MRTGDKCLTTRITRLNYQILLSFIVLIALIRTVFPINIPVFIYLIIVFLMIIVCSKEELIALMCSLLPMLGIMQNRIALLLVAAGIAVRIKRIDLKGAIPLVLMVIWELLHAGQSHLRLYGFLQDFSPLIALTVLLVDEDSTKCDFGFIARSFAWITFVCSGLNIIACGLHYNYSILSFSRLGNLSTEYEDFRGLINPNTNSFICLMGICALLILRYTSKGCRSDKYALIGMIIIVFLTQSKSAILCVVFSLIMFMLFSKAYRKLNSHKLVRIVVAIVGVLILALAFNKTITVIIKRFTNGDISTGRIDITLFYFRHIISNVKNILFGTGLYHYNDQMLQLYPYNNDIWTAYPGLVTVAKGVVVYKPCHLGILEIIVVWGLPGLFLVYLLIRNLLANNRIKNKVVLVPLYIVFVYCLQSGFIGAYSVLHALILIYSGIKYMSVNHVEDKKV